MNLILNFTPTGMIPTKNMTQYAPITVAEIVENVHAAIEIGITMVHLHARNEKTGVPTYKAEIYRDIIEKIRKLSRDLVICVSLSGRNFKEFEKRSEPLYLDGDAKPDMGSLTLSSLNFTQQASMNSPEMIQHLAKEMHLRGIKAELEAFDIGMINYAKYLEVKGLLQPPHYFNLLLGNISGAQPDLIQTGIMIKELPANSYWALAGIGESQLMMNSIAISFGGGVRVGLEDNIWYDSGRSRRAMNSDLLTRIHRLAEIHERKVMPANELRKLLHLEEGNGCYGKRQE